MSLSSGTTLGPYAVTTKIGEGGMLRHERSETVRNCTKMKEGPSEPPGRGRLQTTSSCWGQKPRW